MWPFKERLKYFEGGGNDSGVYRCSDDMCPCEGVEQLIPGKTGYLYVSELVVERRSEAITLEDMHRFIRERSDAAVIYVGTGTWNPILVCEKGATGMRLDLTIAAKDAKHWLETGMCPLRPTPVNGYICDFCGGLFRKKNLDSHFEKLAREAAGIQGVTWSGKMVTFGDREKAWCPTCFPDAESTRRGGRTVHIGKRQPCYPPSETDLLYTCKCGKINKFNSKEVSVFTGAEVCCNECIAILFVPPSIFIHSTDQKKSVIKKDWRSLVSYR